MDVPMFSLAIYLLINSIIHYAVSKHSEMTWKKTMVIVLFGLPAFFVALVVLVRRELK